MSFYISFSHSDFQSEFCTYIIIFKKCSSWQNVINGIILSNDNVLVLLKRQVLTYNGFYDNNLEFVGLEGVQVIASMNAGSSLGRHPLTSRFTSVVRICFIG